MIRNVVLGRLAADAGADALEAVRRGLAGIAGLDLPGLRGGSVGLDAGLREGGWSYAIVNDWDDAAAYRVYDGDAEHNHYRAMLVGASEQVARVQYEVPDAEPNSASGDRV